MIDAVIREREVISLNDARTNKCVYGKKTNLNTDLRVP
jgi:hypothetical protein